MSKKIVVVGGGYAGTEVIRQLRRKRVRDIEIELISNRRYFENLIGSTEIISDKITEENLKYDLKELSYHWDFELTIDNVESIDLFSKKVKLKDNKRDYDVLVVATGAEPNLFNFGESDFVYQAYHLTDFLSIRDKLEQLSQDHLKIAIVGAGFVGLQTAAEILDRFKKMNKKVEITVIEKKDSILPMYNNELAKKISFEQLNSRGVKFILGNGVKQIKNDKIVLEDENRLVADLIIWSAGIKSSEITSRIRGASLRKGFIEVDEKLLIKGHEDAFAVGDVAFVKINGKMAQKMAAEALEQAETVAKNINSIVNNQKPQFNHSINYPTDFPKAFLSLGDNKAILIGSKLLLGSQRSFTQLFKQILHLPGIDRIRNIFSTVMSNPQEASIGAGEYLLKKRIVEEIMEKFPDTEPLSLAGIDTFKRLINGEISDDEEQLLNILENHYITYESALNQVLIDRKVTRDEFKMLDAIRNVIYIRVMNQALKDGKITEKEKIILDAVKKEYRIKNTEKY